MLSKKIINCSTKTKRITRIRKKLNTPFEQTFCEQIYQVCCQQSLWEQRCNVGRSMAILVMNHTQITTCEEQFLRKHSSTYDQESYRCCKECISGISVANYFGSLQHCHRMNRIINYQLSSVWSIVENQLLPSPFFECCRQQIYSYNRNNETIITIDDIDLSEFDYANGMVDITIDDDQSIVIENSDNNQKENTSDDNHNCSIGFRWDRIEQICKDINECQIGTHTCHEALRCDNTIGSFLCVRVQDCGTGYTINADTYECDDIDECQLNIHHCGPDYSCRNTQGSFKCDRIRCPKGQALVNGFCRRTNCEQSNMVFDYETGLCQPKQNPCFNDPCLPTERCILKADNNDEFECVSICSTGYRFNPKGSEIYIK